MTEGLEELLKTVAEAAGATVVELQSTLLPNPVVAAANPRLFNALVAALAEAGAVII